jgi:DNA-binding XRE family transcriptional regulator
MLQIRAFKKRRCKVRSNLKKFRRLVGLTQTEMAELVGLTKSTWCNIEKGRNTGTAEMWVDLATRFKLSIEELKELMEVS